MIVVNIRLEERTDYKEVEYVIREAFWNVYRPGCYEHLIVHNLRHDPSFINQLDYVLEEDGRIIGHVACSRNGIYDENGKVEDVVTLGPVSIHPDYQKCGYGTKLIEHTLNKAEEINIPYIFVVGDEEYYHRFGFENAGKYGIVFNDIREDSPFFMVKVFDKERIGNLHGVYKENEIFNVDQSELDEFDKRFPPKTKEKREGQLNI